MPKHLSQSPAGHPGSHLQCGSTSAFSLKTSPRLVEMVGRVPRSWGQMPNHYMKGPALDPGQSGL